MTRYPLSLYSTIASTHILNFVSFLNASTNFACNYSCFTTSPGAKFLKKPFLSYFPEIQDGHENQTETDRQGEFTLPVIMHDTDKMRVVVEAAGYQPYEESFVGIDLVEGKTLTVGLLPTASTAP